MIIGPGGRNSSGIQIGVWGSMAGWRRKIFCYQIDELLTYGLGNLKRLTFIKMASPWLKSHPSSFSKHLRHDTAYHGLVLEKRSLWYNQHLWGKRYRSRL